MNIATAALLAQVALHPAVTPWISLPVSDSTPALSGREAGLGLEMNSLANEVSAGVTLLVPLSRAVAIDARPVITGGDGTSTLDVGTRLEVQLRSPVYANLLRVYVGVGPQGFYEIQGPERHHTDFSGGWDIGAEVFVGRNLGVHWEMGTSGGSVSGGAGPVFTIGFRAYP